MNVQPIEYISSRLDEFCKANGLSFSFNITTNGSLLKPELVDRLIPIGLRSVKVTLDGDREAHNLKRPFKGQRGSFDKIIENLTQVVDKVSVRIGSNIDDENVDSIPRMLDYLEEIGLKEKIKVIKFNPIVHIQNQDGELLTSRQSDCGSNAEEWGKDYLLPLAWDAFNRGFNVDSGVHFTICSMNRDGTTVVIDPLGRVYTCPAFVGRAGFDVGDIFHDELSDRHKEFMNIQIPDECFECAYMPFCSGGCKHMSYIRYGDLSKTMCEKEFVAKATKEFLKMRVLSGKEGLS